MLQYLHCSSQQKASNFWLRGGVIDFHHNYPKLIKAPNVQKAYRSVIRVAIIADEVLLENDNVLLPEALRVLCLKVKGLAPLTWLGLFVDCLSIAPVQGFLS